MNIPWRLRLLGDLHVENSGQPVTRFRTRATGVLLAYLALHGDRAHSRDGLIELLWPQAPLDTGRHNLSMALSFLRRQLEPPGVAPGAVIVASRSWVRVGAGALQTDAAEFEGALRLAGLADGAERQGHLLTALGLYRGPLLPGHFEDWVWLERARLADRFLAAVQQAVAFLRQTGQGDAALDLARRCVALEPECAEGHALLTGLLLDAGRQPEATRRRPPRQPPRGPRTAAGESDEGRPA